MLKKTLVTTALVTAVVSTSALAQEAPEPPEGYPTRPIELVVVYPAGGGMDTNARTIARISEEILGHEFRVANREGGGGLVGHTFLAREAEADGYTIGVLAMGNLLTDMIVKGGEFEPEDFDPIAFINFDPVVLITRGDTLPDLIEQARQDPGSVRVGVTPNSATAIIADIIQEQEGVEFTMVPFQGGGPRITALLNGTIDMSTAYYAEGDQYYETGDLAPVAVANTAPYPVDPDIPLISDMGIDIPTNALGAARFIALPDGVPEDIRNYLAEAMLTVLESDMAAEMFAEQGLVLSPAGPEETAAIFQATAETLGQYMEPSE